MRREESERAVASFHSILLPFHFILLPAEAYPCVPGHKNPRRGDAQKLGVQQRI